MPALMGVKRGCGDSRTEGAIYLEVSVQSGGLPLEAFLVDPLIPVTPEELGLSTLGVTLWDDDDGVTHVLDWVGQVHYPYPADFLEEGRFKGFSRRVSSALEVERLSPQSTILFVHARGYPAHFAALSDYWVSSSKGLQRKCRYAQRRDERHFQVPPAVACSRTLWVDPPGERGGMRTFTDFRYRVHPQRELPVLRSYGSAIIARLPLSNLSIVASKGGAHHDTLDDLRRRSALPVFEVMA
jgi:hypothetical protein